MELDNEISKGKFMPSEANPLDKVENGELGSGIFSYSSVVGIILYMYGHTRPDVDLAVIGCYRYMFSPKGYHELEFNIFVHFLKHTKDCGLVLNPSYDVRKVDAYPDSDFSGMYGHKNPTDTTCVIAYLSSRLQIFMFCWFQTYRPRLISLLWRHK